MFGIFRSKRKDKINRYIKEGAILLDVRSTTEFEGNHIENSLNIPVQSLDKHLDQLDKDQPIVTYCARGGRSTLAAAKLRKLGYRVVDGGGIRNMRRQLKAILRQ
ncbi:rhodanese-like domain-containing protein [Nonlabens xiamenensis]|uniref:rhodanese-like domain-containing protein n=1 Tax=Nonlabens xiamenensis TaxID=2341043 RepID=UPI000F610D3E|nr:rhodanese-like domain-containing protein [Nonlabens xiamenensis]